MKKTSRRLTKIKKFKEPERNQQILMTHVNLNSMAPVGSPVWIIDKIVQDLDTSDIEKNYKLDVITGQRPIHPKTLLKVSLYAIHSCRFSLRKMEYDLEHSLDYRWLSGDIRIDHSRFGKFLSINKESIVKLFTQVVMLAAEEGLIDFEILCIDSLKLRANASYKQERNMESIQSEMVRIEAKLTELLSKVEKNEEDSEQVRKLEMRNAKLANSAKVLSKRINEAKEGKTESVKNKIEKETTINITDNDAHKMQDRNGEINSKYSISMGVDTQSDVISSFQVNENDNDAAALLPIIQGARENTDDKHKLTAQDSGFSSIHNLEELEKIEQASLMPDKMFEADKETKNPFARVHFIFDEEKNCYTCPVGTVLHYTSQYHDMDGRLRYRYENVYECARCSHFASCCKGERKSISRDHKEGLKETMRENLEKEENKELYKKRAHSAECPTGHIKHNLKFKTVMRRGIEKIKMEVSLLFTLHNILKIGNKIFA